MPGTQYFGRRLDVWSNGGCWQRTMQHGNFNDWVSSDYQNAGTGLYKMPGLPFNTFELGNCLAGIFSPKYTTTGYQNIRAGLQ